MRLGLVLGTWFQVVQFIFGFTSFEQTGWAYYVVKEGDTLWGIAAIFDVSVEDLVELNSLSEASVLSLGDQLSIPGLSGFQYEVDTITVTYGESMTSINRRFQVPRDLLVILNRLTSPRELFVGAEIVVSAEFTEPKDSSRAWVEPGSTLLELAVINNQNPWSLIVDNDLGGSWGALPNDDLTIAGNVPNSSGALPEFIDAVEVTLPAVQGKTFVIKVHTGSELVLSGSFNGRELRFITVEGVFVALQGIHALTEPGFYPLPWRSDTPLRKLTRVERSHTPSGFISAMADIPMILP